VTDLASAPDQDQYVQDRLPFDFQPPDVGAPETAAPADATGAIESSDAFQRLAEMRDEAYGRRRSGARAIAREAFAALQAGELTHDQYANLFPERGAPASMPHAEAREFDHAERAAGEAVQRPGDEE